MAENEANPRSEAGASNTREQFGLQKIYVKDISFETPNSPQIFQEKWQPNVNMDVANSATALSETDFEVVLSVTVTVKMEEKTVYLVEVHQAGIFHISGIGKDLINRMLATACPNILFPFAREFIADMVMRGGFPQLLLAPVNFDALYMQHVQQAAKEAEAKKGGTQH